jgi:hypothetical protein
MLEKNIPKKWRRIEMRLLAAKPSSLYSRFPGGTVGLALLVLRLVDAFGLAGEAIRLFIPAANSLEPTSVLFLGLVLVASAILLMLGVRTSAAGSAAAICTAGAALHSKLSFNLLACEMYAWSLLFALVFFLSGSLALLGPGGYSLDARLSGWRMIRLSSGQSNAISKKGDQYVDR